MEIDLSLFTFRSCLENGKFSTEWKKTNAVPAHKKGDNQKSGRWIRSAIPSMTLSNALKCKIDINLFLICDNVDVLHHRIVLLIDVPREVSD